MTLVTYEPKGPALEFVGHAGAGLYGQDPVCAALSMLLYTLIAACPEASVCSGDGYCRIEGNGRKSASSDGREPGAPDKARRSGFGGEEENGGSGSGAFAAPGGSGRERASFDVVLCGLRLLAKNYPAHVRLIWRGGEEYEPRNDGKPGHGDSSD